MQLLEKQLIEGVGRQWDCDCLEFETGQVGLDQSVGHSLEGMSVLSLHRAPQGDALEETHHRSSN